MRRRAELFSFWQIQENLLQNYRVMAITLLGLISAGILVIITYFLQNRLQITYLKDVNKLDFVLLLLFLTLLILGITGTNRFKKITSDRASIVTFFQNLLLAEEAGKLSDILKRFNLPEDIKSLHLHRKITQKANALPFEYEYDGDSDIEGFTREISLRGSELGQTFNRHHMTRKFLSEFIYDVFYAFYVFASIIFLILALSYFGISTCTA